MLAGCTENFGGGGSGSPSPTQSSDGEDTSTSPGESVSLTWWHLNVKKSRRDFIAKLLEEYEGENPTVSLSQNAIANDSYKTAIKNALGSSEAPDVFFWFTGPNRLGLGVQNGTVEPIKGETMEIVKEQVPIDDMPPGVLNQARFKEGDILSWGASDGDLYAIPNSLSGICPWYNKQVLEEAGVDPDRIKRRTDMTWDEFLEICEAIKQTGKTPIILGNRNQWMVANWMSAFLTKAVGTQTWYGTAHGRNDKKWTDDEYVEALSRMQELFDKGYLNRSINSIDRFEAAGQFFNNQAGFYPTGTWIPQEYASVMSEDYPGIPEAIDYVWNPYFPEMYEDGKNERLAPAAGARCISKRAANRGDTHFDETRKFYAWTESTDTMVGLMENNIHLTPPRPDVWAEVEVDAEQAAIKQNMDQIAEAKATAAVIDIAFLPQPTQTMLSELQGLFTGKDPEKILQAVQKSTDEALSQYQ
jgi:raffinose/stachyose/melibiose transport system substrate-binding protein